MKRRRVPGEGSLWECRVCETRHRDPAGHLAQHDLAPDWQNVWNTQVLLSDARKETRPPRQRREVDQPTLL